MSNALLENFLHELKTFIGEKDHNLKMVFVEKVHIEQTNTTDNIK